MRRGTRAAQKIPANASEVIYHFFLRIACRIRDYNIPRSCIVNSDQTQQTYSQGKSSTWNKRGEKQVAVVGQEEKRAFTLMVGVSMSGKLLPFQAVYAGKDRQQSLPKPTSIGYKEATEEIKIRLDLSGNSSYWSTIETMKTYVQHVLVPYFESQRQALNRPRQHCIWIIDVWSVHRSCYGCVTELYTI
jgi:hypothetical protein